MSIKQTIAIALMATICSGCTWFSNSKTMPKSIVLPPSITNSVTPASIWAGSLEFVSPETATPDILNAIAACECAPAFGEKYAHTLLLQRGIVPELLVPTVRNEIRTNSKLDLLKQLAGPFSGVLRTVFLSDSTLLDEIRTGVLDKVKAATNWTSLSSMPFRFSLFPPVTPIAQSTIGTWDNSMDIAAQAARWAFFFKQEGLWTGATALTREDHSEQLVQIMLILSEIEYAFGLSPDVTGKPFGGLALDVADPMGTPPSSFDPRKPYTTAKFLAGRYTVGIPTDPDGVDIALNSREAWQSSVSAFSLDEQAKIWNAGAQLFKRLRPKARTFIKPLFAANTGIFPEETHTMGLIFLASIEPLLLNQFIDKTNISITTLRSIPKQPPVADLIGTPRVLAIARLLDALTQWNDALQNINDIDLPADTKKQITNAPASLKEAMQFTVMKLLGETVRVIPGMPSTPENVEIFIPKNGGAQPDIAATAEVITALAEASRIGFQSPFLKQRIGVIINRFGNYTLPQAKNYQNDIRPADLFWSLAALKEWTQQSIDTTKYPWLIPTSLELQSMVNKWDAAR